MYRSIVVGFDGGDESRDALALASRLRAEDGIVTAINVYSDPGLGRGSEWNDVMAEVAEEALTRARSDTDDASWLRTVTTPGHSPAHGLHDFAEGQDADLIVVGSSHRGKLGTTLAGTTGHRLLNGSSCPVAIAPRAYHSRPATAVGTVVLGVDSSRESELALSEAIKLAKGAGAQLELVAVAEPPAITYGKGAGFHGYPELRKAIEEIVEKNLRRVAAQVPEDANSHATLVKGETADELAKAAQADDALLVVGSRGYGPLRRVLLGSVSTDLVKAAPCPVMVVPRGVEAKPEQELVADADIA